MRKHPCENGDGGGPYGRKCEDDDFYAFVWKFLEPLRHFRLFLDSF